MLVEAPAQICGAAGVTEISGLESTATVTEALPEQPFTSIPVTLYVVVETGETLCELPVPRPFDQV